MSISPQQISINSNSNSNSSISSISGSNNNSSSSDNNNSNSSSNNKASGSSVNTSAEEAGFICRVCLETPRQPVATVCGHVFCWPCLYKWLLHSSHEPCCPVCKAGIEGGSDPRHARVIPLYITKDSSDPRDSAPEEEQVPSRPRGERPETERQRFAFNFGPTFNDALRMDARNLVHRAGPVSISAGFSLLVSLFGFDILNGAAWDNGNNNEQTRMNLQQAMLSKVLLFLGTIITICLIFF